MKSIFSLLAMIAVVAAIIFVTPKACTNDSDTVRVLASNGYTDIQITGWRPFSKSKDDFYATGFRAKSASGQVVTGTVTGGLVFKNYTVRLD